MTPSNETPSNRAGDHLPAEADQWLREHPGEDRDALESAWQLAAMAEDDAAVFTPDEARVAQMRARIASASHGYSRDRAPFRRIRSVGRLTSRAWGAAATVALLLVVGAVVLWLRPVTTTVPTGELVTVHLPDGSEVELNSGSRLSYRRSFGWRARHVRLEGEAFLDVAHDATPFVVETFNSTVTVLGTRFNVRARQDERAAATTVVLKEGRVRLSAGHDATQSVVLEPGQMSRVPAGSAVPSPPETASVEDVLAWRHGSLHVTDAPLSDIVDEVERRTGTRITLTDPSIAQLRATLILDRVDRAEEVLALLAEMHDLSYRQDDAGYELTRSRP